MSSLDCPLSILELLPSILELFPWNLGIYSVQPRTSSTLRPVLSNLGLLTSSIGPIRTIMGPLRARLGLLGRPACVLLLLCAFEDFFCPAWDISLSLSHWAFSSLIWSPANFHPDGSLLSILGRLLSSLLFLPSNSGPHPAWSFYQPSCGLSSP